MTKYTEENNFTFDHAFDDSVNNQEVKTQIFLIKDVQRCGKANGAGIL